MGGEYSAAGALETSMPKLCALLRVSRRWASLE